MIIYFSATGNTQYVAEKIAAATNDKIISIRQEFFSEEKNFTLADGENFGVILPTYFGGFPSIAEDFFKKIKIHVEGKNHYAFFIATCGGGHGNINLDAENKVEPALNEILEKIVRKEKISLPASISEEEYSKRRAIYEDLRQAKKFYVGEKCVGCGRCARQCPLKVIEIQNKKPVWAQEKCTLCLGCLHVCPVNAINFNHQTEGRGQYHNPRVKKIFLRKNYGKNFLCRELRFH